MKATRLLKEEHLYILRALDVVDEMARGLRSEIGRMRMMSIHSQVFAILRRQPSPGKRRSILFATAQGE